MMSVPLVWASLELDLEVHCGVHRQLPLQLAVRPRGVLHMATTKLDSSRSDVSKRRTVRATTMPTRVPIR